MSTKNGGQQSAAVLEGTNPCPKALPAQGAAAQGKRGTLLVVEDSASVALLQRRRLERAGYTVVSAGTAEEAAQKVGRGGIDLIVLDYLLPGDVTGLDFYARLKGTGRDLPVILVTAASDEATLIKALRAGVRDFVTKSAEYLDYLPEAVERVLKQVHTERQLAESQARLGSIINSAMDAILTVEADRRISFFNPAAELMFRCRAAAAIGQPITRFIPKEFRSLSDSDTGPAPESLEGSFTAFLRAPARGIRADGEVFPLEASVSRVEVDGQKFYTFMCRDITERKQAQQSLKAAKEEWEQSFNAIADQVCVLDKSGTIIRANKAMRHRFWAACNNPIGLDWRVVYYGNTSAGELPCDKVLSGGPPVSLETTLPALEGWHLVSCYPLADKEGKQWGAVTVVRDITERKRAEADLQASEARTRAIIDSALDCVITIDHQDKVVEFNPAAEKTFGYSRTAVLGKDLADLIIPADWRERHRRGLAHYLATGEGPILGQRLELTAMRADGREFPVELTITPLGQQSPRLFAASLRDITERKRAEEQIREQAALLDKARDAILVRDPQDRILYWNHSAERLYGWTAAEAVGKCARELLLKQPLSELDEAHRTVLEKGEWSGELRKVTKSGKEVLVDSRWTLVRDPAGQPRAMFVADTDITEKKRLEAQFFRAQRLESIGTLAGGIAHDLNNVLTPIQMSLQLLKMNIPEDKRRAILTELETSAARGADMVKQILSFARGVEGQHIQLQLKDVIREIEKMLKRTLPRAIEIRTSVPKDLWLISGDATHLYQMLMNLCVNARDAMPEGGRLTVTAANSFLDQSYAAVHPSASQGPYVLLTVADTGMGIPPAILDKIFDPFFTTKEHGKGTGLGLSTVLGIVKSHGGFINVDSEVGKGARFAVYLPAIESEETKQAAEGRTALPYGQGELILVVDDEAAIHQITRETLETFGYRVLTACDGAEAVALYAQHRGEIQAVVTDMMMPVMDGAATIRALQRLNPKVRIIAASGLSPAGKAAEAAGGSVQAFLAKPYTAEMLLTTLHQVLQQRRDDSSS